VAIVFSKLYQVAESCSISYTHAFTGDLLDKLQGTGAKVRAVNLNMYLEINI